MEPYVIVETGGKQQMLRKGDVLDVELLGVAAGEKATLANVLALSDGNELQVGAPRVNGAGVTVQVLELRRGAKVVSFKKKRRKGYHKKIGHRQELARIKVESLGT